MRYGVRGADFVPRAQGVVRQGRAGVFHVERKREGEKMTDREKIGAVAVALFAVGVGAVLFGVIGAVWRTEMWSEVKTVLTGAIAAIVAFVVIWFAAEGGGAGSAR